MAEVFSGGFRLFEHNKSEKFNLKKYLIGGFTSKKFNVRGKVKIFLTDIWFVVFKRSAFKIQKQRTKSCKDSSNGYGEINQNVPKFAVWPKTANFN